MEKIMIVDDNMANLIMVRKTLEDAYEVIPVSSGISALECLNDMPDLPMLVLLDVDMPNVNGFQVISEMKNSRRLANIPIMFITAHDDDINEIEGYNLGAVDYIKRPFTANLLKKRVDIQVELINQHRKVTEYTNSLSAAVREKSKKIIELQYSVVDMFVDMLEKRDSFAGQHAKRVEKDLECFLERLVKEGLFEYKKEDVETICFASKIHDVGKLCILDKYLQDTENGLNVDEFAGEVIKTHTKLGADTISKITQLSTDSENNFMSFARNMCRSHHENWDGSGYPDRLQGKNIPYEARVLAVVNTYDNYRYMNKDGRNLSHAEAIMKLKFLKFTMLDPDLVDCFTKIEREIAKINP